MQFQIAFKYIYLNNSFKYNYFFSGWLYFTWKAVTHTSTPEHLLVENFQEMMFWWPGSIGIHLSWCQWIKYFPWVWLSPSDGVHPEMTLEKVFHVASLCWCQNHLSPRNYLSELLSLCLTLNMHLFTQPKCVRSSCLCDLVGSVLFSTLWEYCLLKPY